MIRPVIAIAILSAAAPASAGSRADPALNAIYERLAAAKAENAPEKVASEFAAQATLISARPGPPIRGDALAGALRPMAERLKSEKVTVSTAYRVESRRVLGDVALDSGYMRTLFAAPAGAARPRDMYNRFLVTFRKKSGGDWKIVGDASLPATSADWDKAARTEGLKFDE